MAESATASNVVSNVFLDALDRVRPEFAQLDTDDLLPITLDPVAAAVTVRGALPKITALRTELAKLSTFEIRYLDNLDVYLHAWLRANALFLGAALPPEGFTALVAKVTSYRDTLSSDAEALARRGLLGAEALASLKGSVGHKNVVSDVLTLTTLFRSNWDRVTGRTCVTLAELDEADSALDALITDLAVREQSPATRENTAIERQKAYTLFVNAYDQVRRAITFLRWDENDGDEIAPSLFGGRKRKPGTEAEPKPDTAPATTAATPTATVPAAVLSTANKPGVGLPGADPFTS